MSNWIDPTIQLGHVLSSLSDLIFIVIAALSTIITVRADNKHIKKEVGMMQQELTKITDILVALGRQDERLRVLEDFKRAYEG